MNLASLGYVLKGKFTREDHDFSLDNYAPIGNYCVMLTLDSIRVLDCLKLEMWEVQNDDFFSDDNLLENTINTLNGL